MQARYVILRVLLEAGGGLVRVGEERIELDRARILSVGRPAIAAFLQKLNVYKVTRRRGEAVRRSRTAGGEEERTAGGDSTLAGRGGGRH